MRIRSRVVQSVLAGIVGAAILGASVDATVSEARETPRLARPATFPIVFRTKDARTGLEIRTTQTKLDEVVVEVHDASVAIRKRIGMGSSETVLTARAGALTMQLRDDGFTVKTGTERLTGKLTHRDSLAPLNAAIAKSPAARLARTLLTRLTLNPDSVPGHALLLTRALLQSVDGDRTGAESLAGWSRQQKARTTVRRINLDNDGPDYCWDTYAIAAIKIWESYTDCYEQCSTWNVLCKGGCAVIYDLRAEGAFAWWLKCTALRS